MHRKVLCRWGTNQSAITWRWPINPNKQCIHLATSLTTVYIWVHTIFNFGVNATFMLLVSLPFLGWRRGWKVWLILRWRKVFGELSTPAFTSNRQPPFSCWSVQWSVRCTYDAVLEPGVVLVNCLLNPAALLFNETSPCWSSCKILNSTTESL